MKTIPELKTDRSGKKNVEESFAPPPTPGPSIEDSRAGASDVGHYAQWHSSSFASRCLTGLRCLTAPGVVCWAVHLGWLDFAGSKLAFADHPMALVVLTISAVVELIADKQPKTPARTTPPGLKARVVLGFACCRTVALATNARWQLAASCNRRRRWCSIRDSRGLQNPPRSGVARTYPRLDRGDRGRFELRLQEADW